VVLNTLREGRGAMVWYPGGKKLGKRADNGSKVVWGRQHGQKNNWTVQIYTSYRVGFFIKGGQRARRG